MRFADGTSVAAHAVVVATGVFYRTLDAPGVCELTGRGVYYGSAMTEADACAGQDVYIVGAANSAGQAAVFLARRSRSVHLLCRGPSLQASMSQYLRHQIQTTPNIEVWLRHEVAGGGGGQRLERLEIRNNETGEIITRPAAALFILFLIFAGFSSAANKHRKNIENGLQNVEVLEALGGVDRPGYHRPDILHFRAANSGAY